jgi:hypothetical protein
MEAITHRLLATASTRRADNLDELRELMRDAVQLHFSEQQPPGIIWLHFVRDELLAL